MTKIIDKLNAAIASGTPFFSFEYFPPKTDEGVANLKERQHRMAALGPTFCDITWGAGGSTADLTLDIARGMQQEVRSLHACWARSGGAVVQPLCSWESVWGEDVCRPREQQPPSARSCRQPASVPSSQACTSPCCCYYCCCISSLFGAVAPYRVRAQRRR